MLINDILINENKIIGIIGENSIERLDFCNTIKNIDSSNTFIVSDKNLNVENNVKEEFDIFLSKDTSVDREKKIDEVLKMVGLNNSYLYKSIYDLSESEQVMVAMGCMLLANPKIIILEDFFGKLDKRVCNKFLKILIRLKKYYKRTIFISISNIDSVYEILDDIIYLKDNDIEYNNKYTIYNDDSLKIVPNTIKFTNLMRKKYPNMKYTDSINELIKELYREIR